MSTITTVEWPGAVAREIPEEEQVLLRSADTGVSVSVPRSALSRPSELRRRVRLQDPSAGGVAPSAEDRINVDVAARVYTASRYSPIMGLLTPSSGLGALRGMYWYVVIGAFLIAGCAQVSFYFPCVSGTVPLTFHGGDYCVPSSAEASATACAPDVCTAQRIPVTLQTYGAMLNGALAGPWVGGLATFLYLVMIALGAPFGAPSGGKPPTSNPVWERRGLVGPTGGFFWGFVAASIIMGHCAVKGHDRPRSAYWLVLWICAAELAIFVPGLVWMPLGVAVEYNIPPKSVCTTAAQCLTFVAANGLTPFVPGELLKMFLVLLTIPACWEAVLCARRVTAARAIAAGRAPGELKA